MARAYKVLGQLVPVAGALSTLYVAGAQAVVSTITLCNEGTIDAKVRVSVAVAAAADDPKHYLVYDLVLEANETRAFTLGATLGATDVIRVYSSTGQVAFQAFGTEIS